MKKEIKYAVITLSFMTVVTMVFLFAVSILTLFFRWQADDAMKGIFFTYIATGLSGGILRGRWIEKKEQGGSEIGRAILYGMILASLYFGIPGGIAMVLLQEKISDMGYFALCWGMMSVSITVGIMFRRCKRKKVYQNPH